MLDPLPKNCNFQQKDSTKKISNKNHGHFARGFQLMHLDTNTSSKFKFLNTEWVFVKRSKDIEWNNKKDTSRVIFPISYINTTSLLYETKQNISSKARKTSSMIPHSSEVREKALIWQLHMKLKCWTSID